MFQIISIFLFNYRVKQNKAKKNLDSVGKSERNMDSMIVAQTKANKFQIEALVV